MKGSHFSRTNCSNVMVVSGRFCLRFLDRRQLARSARASLFEIWLTDPRTFERRTLLRVLSCCNTVSRQRATHIFWPFPLIVKHPFWKRRRITFFLSVIRPLVLASLCSVDALSSRMGPSATARDPGVDFLFPEAPVFAEAVGG